MEAFRLSSFGPLRFRSSRSSLFDELIEHRQKQLEQREWREVVPREIIVANLDWTMGEAPRLAEFLDSASPHCTISIDGRVAPNPAEVLDVLRNPTQTGLPTTPNRFRHRKHRGAQGYAVARSIRSD